MAKLVIFDSGGRREVDLIERNSIGRHPQNNVQVLDRVVSKEHCMIYRDPVLGYMMRDLGSLNGTFVNGARVEGQAPLKDGYEIKLGNTRCMFLDQAGTEAPGDVVAVTDGEVQSHIRSKIKVTDRFLPEIEIKDDKQLRSDYEKLRAVYELQREVGLELDLDKMLNKILERTFQFLNCDRGVILMPDESGQFVPKVYKTKKADKISISSTLIKAVQKDKSGILSSDAQMDNRFKEARSIIMQGIRSSMAVPIMHQRDLLAIMIIDSSVAVNAYTEKDLQLLSNIANQAGQLIKNSEMAHKIEKDAATRDRFQRLLSPDLAELVVSGALKVEKGGEARIATVLFADIRGFTAMSENMSASSVLQMLNEYFEVMVEVVFQHEGTVDKFVGDEIMVLWGAPVKHHDDPMRAVSSAVAMQRALVEFNETRASEGQPPIQIGIGINTGELVAGYIGSTRTMSYSVIGDIVNTAARLCSASKAGEILVSEATHQAIGGAVRTAALAPMKVKGKAKPLQVFKVLDLEEMPAKTLDLGDDYTTPHTPKPGR